MQYVLFTYYVPLQYDSIVADACFKAGAGKLGNYQQCCWKTMGKGQFQPLEAAKPFIGKINTKHIEDELKVEMICPINLIDNLKKAFLEAHPYETPVYFFLNTYEL